MLDSMGDAVALIGNGRTDLLAWNPLGGAPQRGGIWQGFTRTPELERLWEATIPLGRVGVPDQLKGPALFLASQASSSVTGMTLPLDGGALGLVQAAY